MTTVIWKYPLVKDRQSVPIPAGAQILCVKMQDGHPTLWVLIHGATNPVYVRSFFVVGTGEPFEMQPRDHYVGTVEDGPFIWHVIEAQPLL